MKTNELVKRVKALGYEVKKNTYFGMVCLDILNNKGDRVAAVNSHRPYDIYTSAMFYLESEKNQSKLFDLLVEYAKTPTEEREEEKKYYLRLIGADITERGSYLNKNYDRSIYFLNQQETCREQTKFTDEEISKLPTWVSDMLRDGYLIKEEVKDDNEN